MADWSFCDVRAKGGPSLAQIRRQFEKVSSSPAATREEWQRMMESLGEFASSGKGDPARRGLLMAGKASLRFYQRFGGAEHLDEAIKYLSEFTGVHRKGNLFIAGLRELKAAHCLKAKLAVGGRPAGDLGPAAKRRVDPGSFREQGLRQTSFPPVGATRGRQAEPSPAVSVRRMEPRPLPPLNRVGNPFFPGPVAPVAPIEKPLVEERPAKRASVAPAAVTVPAPAKRSRVSPARSYVIVIDPGHGGKDPGAVSRDGKVKEKDLALAISKRLKEYLVKRIPGVTVVMTREDDIFLSLKERTTVANSHDADLFLSIHCNGHGDPSSRGIETFFLSKAGSRGAMRVAAKENGIPLSKMSDLQATLVDLMVTSKKTESDRLANAVHSKLVDWLARVPNLGRDRGVKGAPFYVLLGANMPAILIECAFVSNGGEKERLTGGKNLDLIAEGLAEGAKNYLEGLGDKG